MIEFDEFRLQVFPSPGTPGQWDLTLIDCPDSARKGFRGSTSLAFNRSDLVNLRTSGFANAGNLEGMGGRAWGSLMAALAGDFNACQLISHTNGRRLRFVLVFQGQGGGLVSNSAVGILEFPFEILFDALNKNYVALNPCTPVSRSLQYTADRPAYKVNLPIRILVLVASPADQPTASMAQERKVIADALDVGAKAGKLTYAICNNPSREDLRKQLKNGFDVLHFVGHGAFHPIGADPTPQAHLCLVRPTDKLSDPIDAATLAELLRGTGVRLVVLTACVSAVPSAIQSPYPIVAFDGVAQRLALGNSDIAAVVAMQFDLEDWAAVKFSEAFYENLTNLDLGLDEVVTEARRRVSLEKGVGHRAWVAPCLYWRCKGGKLFDPAPVSPTGVPINSSALLALDDQIAIYRKYLAQVADLSRELQTSLVGMVENWHAQVAAIEERREQLIGGAVRVYGGEVGAGGRIECRLAIRLRNPTSLGPVRFRLDYPESLLTFVQAGASRIWPELGPEISATASSLSVQATLPASGVAWPAGEYDVGSLIFDAKPGTTSRFADLLIAELKVDPGFPPNPANPALSPGSTVVWIG